MNEAERKLIDDAQQRFAARRRHLGIVPPPPRLEIEEPEPEPRPCEKCGAARMVDPGVPAHVRILCIDCHNAETIENNRIKREQWAAEAAEFKATQFAPRCNIPARYAESSFAAWRGPVPVDVKGKPWHEAWIEKPTANVILFGPAGIGKTHIAVSLLRALWDRDDFNGKHFFSVPMLNAALIADIRNDTDRTSRKLANCPLVVFDDVARVRASKFASEEFAAILYRRHEQRLPSIVTSNFHPQAMYTGDEAAEGDTPTWSRILEDAVLVGDYSQVDWRLRKASA